MSKEPPTSATKKTAYFRNSPPVSSDPAERMLLSGLGQVRAEAIGRLREPSCAAKSRSLRPLERTMAEAIKAADCMRVTSAGMRSPRRRGRALHDAGPERGRYSTPSPIGILAEKEHRHQSSVGKLDRPGQTIIRALERIVNRRHHSNGDFPLFAGPTGGADAAWAGGGLSRKIAAANTSKDGCARARG